MIRATTLISNVQEEFEGGNSLGIDWDITIKKATRNMLDNCVPPTLKRTVPLYGGIVEENTRFNCPLDVETPVFLRDNRGIKKINYRPANIFHTKNEPNVFTIEYINGAKFIIVRNYVPEEVITIDTMESVGTKTGGNPTLNNHNFITGAGAIDFTADESGTTLKDTMRYLQFASRLL